MKICLYSEFYKIFGGTENVGGGLISALENQKKTLNFLRIPFTEKYDDDWDILQVNIPWPKSLWKIKQAKKRGKKTVMWSHVTVEDLEKSVALFKLPGAHFLDANGQLKVGQLQSQLLIVAVPGLPAGDDHDM